MSDLTRPVGDGRDAEPTTLADFMAAMAEQSIRLERRLQSLQAQIDALGRG